MNIKPLNQRQLFTTMRKNLEKKVSVYFDETKNTSVVIEYIIAILVRNALTIKDFHWFARISLELFTWIPRLIKPYASFPLLPALFRWSRMAVIN